MRVNKLVLDGFRNYDLQEAEFQPGVNVIVGDNAQGKTNLLEAVYCLTCGSAFRARTDREVIGFDRDAAFIKAEVFADSRDQTIDIAYFRGRRKSITVNGAKLKTSAELSGRLRAVLFCPEDLNMIREGPAVRRKLMDSCLTQLRPRYAKLLSDYTRTIEQKSGILRQWRERPELLAVLDDYDEHLAKLGAALIRYRAQLVRSLSVRAAAIHREFSSGAEELSMAYKTVSTVTDPFAGSDEITAELSRHLVSHRQAELETGQCLSGVHRDDLVLEVGGVSAKMYASQGQARTAALSIKLAQRDLLRDDGGEYPILLLDDVLSELDSARRRFVLGRIAGGQVLITCCDMAEVESIGTGKLLTVKAGVIS